MAGDHTKFKGVTNIGDSQLMVQLQSNLVEFCNWAMLGIGGFYNVRLADQAPYGGSPAQLRLSDDRRYASGKIWEGFRSNWIWENSIDYTYQPIQISGIYVNNTFYPTGTVGAFSYNINYPLGRVVFNSPISTASTVKLEYSYRMYNFFPATVQWFRQIVEGLSRIDDSHFGFSGSGIWSTFGDSRVTLPAVVVESVPRRNFTPKALGGGQFCYQDVIFHIFAEKSFDRDNMIDILTYQNEKRFFMFDQNALASSGIFPLNQYGYLVNGSYTYPFLVGNYLWRSAIIWDVTSQQVESNPPNMYRGIVRMTLEIDFSEL